MRILLSNDDGIHARGMKILEEIAETLSDDIWIVAPELDQSGASHSLTLKDPLRIREVGPRSYAINGTPTDCVMLAVCHMMKNNPPDLILSGVNNGSNAAEDVIYSGTVAAAMEGALLNIPSVALSLGHKNNESPEWQVALDHGPSILKMLLHQKWSPDILMNVNFPYCKTEDVKGIRVTHQGQRKMSDNFLKRTDPRGKPYYWVGAVDYDDVGTHGSDLEAIFQGYISVTPLSFHLTHEPSMAILDEMLKKAS